jgi:hypothetical protein
MKIKQVGPGDPIKLAYASSDGKVALTVTEKGIEVPDALGAWALINYRGRLIEVKE